MPSLQSAHDSLMPPATPRRGLPLVAALLVHGVLIGLLALGVQWQSAPQDSDFVAEIWDAQPQEEGARGDDGTPPQQPQPPAPNDAAEQQPRAAAEAQREAEQRQQAAAAEAQRATEQRQQAAAERAAATRQRQAEAAAARQSAAEQAQREADIAERRRKEQEQQRQAAQQKQQEQQRQQAARDKAEADRKQAEARQQQDAVRVVIRANGAISVGRDRQGQPQDIGSSDLTAAVQAAQAGSPEVPVLISADKTLPYDSVMQVYSQLKQAGVQRIALAVQPVATR